MNDFLYIAVPKGENVVSVMFQYSWLCNALLNCSCFNFFKQEILVSVSAMKSFHLTGTNSPSRFNQAFCLGHV